MTLSGRAQDRSLRQGRWRQGRLDRLKPKSWRSAHGPSRSFRNEAPNGRANLDVARQPHRNRRHRECVTYCDADRELRPKK